jgi:LmbE family N-acetylglucosaminyl deacetylase
MTVHKVFLSPHFDDVALSCGGIVAMATAAGERVLVVTVCGALPSPEARSSLTDKIHRVRGFADGVAYVSARREEDRAAAAILGAHIEWGSSLDAIYRRPADYNRSATLVGPPVSGDPLFPEAAMLIADLRRRFPRATFYAPLAIGGHIDHRVISAAARTGGGDVCFYEEFPHGAVPGPRMPRGKSEVIDVGVHASQRVAAVLCYRSQIRPLFGDEDAARAAVNAHVESTGGERIWRF